MLHSVKLLTKWHHILILNNLTNFSAEFLFIFDKSKRMLKIDFQQVLKHFASAKTSSKAPGTQPAARTLTPQNFAATRQLVTFALKKCPATEWRQRRNDALHTHTACA